MTRDTYSRREHLHTIGTVGAVIGGSALAFPPASAEDGTNDDGSNADQPDEQADDSALRLVPKCIDERRGGAAFCVVNERKTEATVEWRATESKNRPDDREEPEGSEEPEEAEVSEDPEMLEESEVSEDPAESEEYVEYLDCQTFRVVGNFADVAFEASFLQSGEIGNVIEFVGPVEGERTIDVTEVETVPDDAIVGYAEAFEEGATPTPGNGDVTASNPEFDACQEAFFGEVVVESEATGSGGEAVLESEATENESEDDGDDDSSCGRSEETADETNADADDRTDADTGDETDADAEDEMDADAEDETDAADERSELAVPAKSAVCFPVAVTDGTARVTLFEDGREIDTRSIDAETGDACPVPVDPDADGQLTVSRPN